MSSIIEFNGKKYDSLTGRILSSGKKHYTEIDEKKVFKPEPKNTDGVVSAGKKIEVKSEFEAQKPPQKPHASATHKAHARKQKVEKSRTLMRTAVKKPKHQPASEHKPPFRVGLNHEQARERAHRAKYIQKSNVVTKFSKSAPKRRSDIIFSSKPLPVAVRPAPPRETEAKNVVTQAEEFAGKLEEAVQSAESHLENYTDKKFRSKKSRTFAYALASFTSVLLIGFAVYQAVPFVQVKLASNNAGFDAALPGYAPSGYGLEKKLQADNGEVTMTYSSNMDNKDYKIIQTPSKWNSNSLLNSYVLPYSSDYEQIDSNGQTVYLYNGKNSATWLDNGIWYRLDGASNFSNDQLIRIVQGL